MAVQISGNDITVPRDTTVTRNLTVGGVLTYEDVTNVDSVGLVTARSGIEIGARPGVAASISVDGNMIVSGISTFGGDIQVSDKIIHSGDTNTSLRFPAADTITAETGGSERLRIDSNGNIGINDTGAANFTGYTNVSIHGSTGGAITFGDDGTDEWEIYAGDGSIRVYDRTNTTERLRIDDSGRLLLGTTTEGVSTADDLTLATDGNTGITIRSGSSSNGNIFFSDGTSGNAELEGYIQYDHSSNYMRFATGATERLRIDSSGQFSLGRTSQITGNGNSSTSVFEQLSNSNYPLALHSAQTNKRGLLIFYATTGAGNAGDPFIACTDNTNNKFQVTSDGTTTIRGNLVMATAGKGIDFSATANTDQTGSSMSSELLDDYEEGSWTPGNSDMGITNHYAYYTKVGRMVHIVMDITFASSPSDTSQVGYVTQLPFDAGNFAQHVSVQWFGTSSVNNNNYYNTWMQTYVASGDDKLSILDARYGSYVPRSTLAGKKLRANFWYVSS